MNRIPAKPFSDLCRVIRDVKAKEAQLDKATDALGRAIDTYLDAVKPTVIVALKEFQWMKTKGRGARTFIEAAVPTDSIVETVHEHLRDAVDAVIYRRSYNMVFSDFTLYAYRDRLSRDLIVKMNKTEAEKIGIKFAVSDKAERRRMHKMLDDANLSSSELGALLEKKKK